MKLRWLFLGAVVVAGGIFALKHYTDNKKSSVENIDTEGQNYSDTHLSNISDIEYQEIDFLA